jgi:hypothetical protein
MPKSKIQKKAHNFRKKLTPAFDSPAEQSQSYAKFLCQDVSLNRVLKESTKMVLDNAETDSNREQALTVKHGIENALQSNSVAETAQLSFQAGLRWMQIYWTKSLKSPGGDRVPEWEYIEKEMALYPMRRKKDNINNAIGKFEMHTGKQARPVDYFQKKFRSLFPKNTP